MSSLNAGFLPTACSGFEERQLNPLLIRVSWLWVLPEGFAATFDDWNEKVVDAEPILYKNIIIWGVAYDFRAMLNNVYAFLHFIDPDFEKVLAFVRFEIDPFDEFYEGAEGEENNLTCGAIQKERNGEGRLYSMLEGAPCRWSW